MISNCKKKRRRKWKRERMTENGREKWYCGKGRGTESDRKRDRRRREWKRKKRRRKWKRKLKHHTDCEPNEWNLMSCISRKIKSSNYHSNTSISDHPQHGLKPCTIWDKSVCTHFYTLLLSSLFLTYTTILKFHLTHAILSSISYQRGEWKYQMKNHLNFYQFQ